MQIKMLKLKKKKSAEINYEKARHSEYICNLSTGEAETEGSQRIASQPF